MAKIRGIGVGANVMEKSVTYVCNTVIQLFFRILHKRGLDAGFLSSSLEVLENGLRTWLGEQKLKEMHLEVSLPHSSDALEDWKAIFEYYAEPDENVRKPPVEEVERICQELRALPAGAIYRIVAVTEPDASDVPGWIASSLKPLRDATERPFSGWGYGHVGAKFFYHGGFLDGLHNQQKDY